MENKNTINNSLVNIEVPDCVDKTLKNLTDKPSTTLGNILSDCLFLVFGGISQKAALKRVKYNHELNVFTKELEDKIKQIPDGKRLEPNVHVVCTALENMKYCVEEPELRQLFSSLIANSINKDRVSEVHPSYGEIIKQLTPFDAIVFDWLNQKQRIPVLKIKIDLKKSMNFMLGHYIYLESNFENKDKLLITLDNLSRLKLIDLDFEKQYADKNVYDSIINNNDFKNDVEKTKKQIKEEHSISYDYGLVEITSFGKHFYKACC
ncbi:DUF4393 domain-containing protein [Anaerovibrio lipolyticus]|uniref:DUF4393 domain-containing protein n=1 Tax=Anaerovibrio lipolyticus TaxID=82374 RepID=UPI0026EDA6B9|nr:DUF4393 domain-containing protein [Anaerovibrio lipolyticus]MBE6105260.1 DUF4393 domain-containing protein [Anaerovibrio lipolyticus]